MTQALDAPVQKRIRLADATVLTFDNIPDGYVVKRVGANFEGVDPATFGGGGSGGWTDADAGIVHLTDNGDYVVVGADARTSHIGDQERLLVKKDQNLSTIIRAENYSIGDNAEATLAAVCEGNRGGVLLAMGPNATDRNGYGALDTVFSTYGTMSGLALRTGGSVPIKIITNDLRRGSWLGGGGQIVGSGSAMVGSELLRVMGSARVEGTVEATGSVTFGDGATQTGIIDGTNHKIGLNVTSPTSAIQIRRDAADSNTAVTLDNRNASAAVRFNAGNDPLGSNKFVSMVYDTSVDRSSLVSGSSAADGLYVQQNGNLPIREFTNGNERRRTLGSGEVIIGNSYSSDGADYILQLKKTDTSARALLKSGLSSGAATWEILNDANKAILMGVEGSASGGTAYGGPAYASLVRFVATNTFVTGTAANADYSIITNSLVRASFLSSGEFIPSTDAAGSIGKSGTRWNDIWVVNTHIGDLHLDNEEMDTHWTIREATRAEEDKDCLYFINRRLWPHRKYKLDPSKLLEAA